jgi:ABC-type multidrug transport system ATPase subunit
MDSSTAKVKDSYEMNSEFEQNRLYAEQENPLTCYEEKTQRVNEFTKIFFEWKNVNYVVTRAQAKDQKEMKVLKNVSGYANPGELVVLMGSSGAGKTTLLNILCNRVSNDKRVKFEGLITANGTNINDFRFKDYVGYVTQEDVMMPTMTCRESLTFAATLKIKASKDKINSLVNEMLAHLRLTRVADVIVGSAIQKGISGGERKRVAIGIELISEPSIIFLDEPTSGLDSYTAGIVVDLLLEEAKKGRTIITTLHQPSAEIFKKFQRLILMMEGNIVYQGSAKHSRHYFRELGLDTPKFVNPVDYYMEILHIKSRDNKSDIEQERLDMLCSAYIQNEPELSKSKCKFNIDEGDLTTILSKSSSYNTSWFVQFREILKRSMLNTRRHPIVFKMLLVQTLQQSIFSIALWNTLPTDDQGVQSRTGYLFFIVLQQYFQGNSSMVLSCKI